MARLTERKDIVVDGAASGFANIARNIVNRRLKLEIA